MQLIDGHCLCNVDHVEQPEKLYHELMSLIVRLGNYGLIHCDFNEFNLLVNDEGKATLIDFPQMISTEHENAEW